MANIDDDLLFQLNNNKSLIYIGYQCDPKSNTSGWLKEGNKLPEETFRVEMLQRFPVISSTGFIGTASSSYYIYVGRKVDVSLLLANSDLLRDDVRNALDKCKDANVSYAVVADVSKNYREDGEVFVYPITREDLCVSRREDLDEIVSTIADLHADLIQKPITDNAKTYRKTFLNSGLIEK